MKKVNLYLHAKSNKNWKGCCVIWVRCFDREKMCHKNVFWWRARYLRTHILAPYKWKKINLMLRNMHHRCLLFSSYRRVTSINMTSFIWKKNKWKKSWTWQWQPQIFRDSKSLDLNRADNWSTCANHMDIRSLMYSFFQIG